MIRKANENDIDSVSAIYERIVEPSDNKKQFTGWLKGVYPTRDTALAALKRGDLFVYEEDGEIIASAVINHLQVDVYEGASWEYEAKNDEVMVLHTLTVDPTISHRGIGRQFVEFYENYAKENGCFELRIDTNARNEVARNFYKKTGFKEIGIVPTVFNGIPNVELVLLEKHIGK